MPPPRVLVADGDAASRALLAELVGHHGGEATVAARGAEALQLLESDDVDLVLTSASLPDLPAGLLLRRACERRRDTPVILVTPDGAPGAAAQAMRGGAFACVARPALSEGVEFFLRRAAEWRALLRAGRGARLEPVPRAGAHDLVGRHPKIAAVVEMVRRVAPSKATLLVQGESGTGKELVARLAHAAGPRAGGPLVAVNCAALSESLLESELFGHERGAFTGAIACRQGRFELADGGTLLLDEISEVPLALQAKLLRAIEEEEFERVGGNRTLKVDVRLVCTTNRDLAAEVAAGRFRADLFYRLNVVPVVLPPLRERRDDVPLLVHHFLRRFRPESAAPVRAVSREAMDILVRYPWPGNVRELRNVIHRAVVLGSGDTLGPEDLPSDLTAERRRGPAAALLVGRSIDDVERDLILRTLASTGGNKTEAARLLKVTPRTLRNKLGRYSEELLGEGPAGPPIGTA